jgi:GGDEF domain-containing protein
LRRWFGKRAARSRRSHLVFGRHKLLWQADAALYRAKEEGRRTHYFFEAPKVRELA